MPSISQVAHAFAIAGFSTLVQHALAQHYVITDLGTLGTGDISEAYGLNEQGDVVGYSLYQTGNYDVHAFVWRNGVMTDLGTLMTGGESTAYDINNQGEIVGTADVVSGFGSVEHAFRWRNGVMSDLGTLGGNFSKALAINNNGWIVGQSKTASGDYRGFIWHNNAFTILQPIAGGIDTEGRGINDLNVVTGYAYPTGGNAHLAIWDGTGNATDLGLLNNAYSPGNDINDGGSIVGQNNVPSKAFAYANGNFGYLGQLPYDTYSNGYAINNNGLAAGNSYHGGHGLGPGDDYTRAAIWENGWVYDLNELIDWPSPWNLQSARDVNDAGQVAGSGVVNGEYHAFLASPVPGSIGVTAPRPGRSAQNNTIYVRGATPGATVRFVYGLARGSTNIPGCSGERYDIRSAVAIGTALADSDGVARVTAFVPAAAKSRTLFIQAVELGTCKVSNVAQYRFAF